MSKGALCGIRWRLRSSFFVAHGENLSIWLIYLEDFAILSVLSVVELIKKDGKCEFRGLTGNNMPTSISSSPNINF